MAFMVNITSIATVDGIPSLLDRKLYGSKSNASSSPYSSNAPTDPISFEVYMLYRQINLVAGILISVTGIVTNVINLYTFIKMGLEESVTISFFALACSDFLVCTIAFSGNICGLCEVIEQEMGIYMYVPPFVPIVYIENFRRLFVLTSVLIITYLSVQRCLCVLVPFHVRGMFTKVKTYCLLLVVFVFSTLCYSLYTWRHQVKEVFSVTYNATQMAVYVISGSDSYLFIVEVILGIVTNMSCISINIMCLLVMGVTLRKSARFRKSATAATSANGDNVIKPSTIDSDRQDNATQKSTSKETQALKQVSLISVIFLLTNIPLFGYGVATILVPEFKLYRAYHNLFCLVVFSIMLTENINASVNFFVYYKFNSKFRTHCAFPAIKQK